MKTYFAVLLLLAATSLFAQSNLVLNFNAIDNTTSLPLSLDSVVISNLATGEDTTVYGAAPSLVLLYTGINDELSLANGIYLSEPFPNPTSGETELNLAISYFEVLGQIF